jgi:hypothetical protein
MKTRSRLCILFFVLSSIYLSSCAIGGFVIKENDGFGNNNTQKNQLVTINSEITMN